MQLRILFTGLVALVLFIQGCGEFKWITPPPGVALPTAEATALAIDVEEAGQQNCLIAGNIAGDGSLIYHVPGGAYYNRVKIDLDRGEEWLCTEEEAVAKGYRKAER